MDFSDPQQVAQKLVEANSHGEEQLTLALIVLLCVFLARRYGPKLPGKVGLFFKSGMGGMALSFLIGQLGAIATALQAGAPFSLKLMLSGVVVSLIGSGMHAQVKQAKQSRAKSVAATVVLLLILPLMSGCAASYAAVFESLTKVEQMNGDFAEQFPKLNKDKLERIVAASRTYVEGEAAMNEWNKTANRYVKAVEGTHEGAQLVRDNVERIRKGALPKADYGKWASFALRLALDMKDLLTVAGVNLEGHHVVPVR